MVLNLRGRGGGRRQPGLGRTWCRVFRPDDSTILRARSRTSRRLENLVDPEIANERVAELLVSGVAVEAKCVSEDRQDFGVGTFAFPLYALALPLERDQLAREVLQRNEVRDQPGID